MGDLRKAAKTLGKGN